MTQLLMHWLRKLYLDSFMIGEYTAGDPNNYGRKRKVNEFCGSQAQSQQRDCHVDGLRGGNLFWLRATTAPSHVAH